MRKPFLDNLRHSIVLLVILYHVFYLFNSVGVITNVDIPGIPELDAVLYVLYPWFMVTLFAISGICARYSLEKQTDREFLRSKVCRQFVPSIAIIFSSAGQQAGSQGSMLICLAPTAMPSLALQNI